MTFHLTGKTDAGEGDGLVLEAQECKDEGLPPHRLCSCSLFPQLDAVQTLGCPQVLLLLSLQGVAS